MRPKSLQFECSIRVCTKTNIYATCSMESSKNAPRKKLQKRALNPPVISEADGMPSVQPSISPNGVEVPSRARRRSDSTSLRDMFYSFGAPTSSAELEDESY